MLKARPRLPNVTETAELVLCSCPLLVHTSCHLPFRSVPIPRRLSRPICQRTCLRMIRYLVGWPPHRSPRTIAVLCRLGARARRQGGTCCGPRASINEAMAVSMETERFLRVLRGQSSMIRWLL